MNFNFKKSAQEQTTFSKIMTGREKVKTDYIIKNYPNGITLTEFDLVTMYDSKKERESTFPVFAFKENAKECFFGGTVLTKVAVEWVEQNGGLVEETSEGLKNSGGVKIKMEKGETKNGDVIVRVQFLD